jgi:hypothetical protein
MFPYKMSESTVYVPLLSFRSVLHYFALTECLEVMDNGKDVCIHLCISSVKLHKSTSENLKFGCTQKILVYMKSLQSVHYAELKASDFPKDGLSYKKFIPYIMQSF